MRTRWRGTWSSRAWTVESDTVAGDTAVVGVVNVWAGLSFRDTLTLLHHDGRWQIVNVLWELKPEVKQRNGFPAGS